MALAAMSLGGALAWWLAADDGGGPQPVTADASPGVVLRLVPRLLATYPHDPSASTQGLVWFETRLYESTGLRGQSSLRRVRLEDGRVERRVELASELFGEGLARVGTELVQLTWQSGRALRWALDDFAPLGEDGYSGEGWGLCYDGVQLWRSDGSARLHRHGASDFAPIDHLDVTLDGLPVERLNELECAEGWIYANVWQTTDIVRIDPATGKVMAVIDVASLLSGAERQGAGVANGIAYRPESETFLLTGKNWPHLFEVVFADPGVS